MTIIFFDGSKMDANEIEFGVNGLIIDGHRIVREIEILRIVAN